MLQVKSESQIMTSMLSETLDVVKEIRAKLEESAPSASTNIGNYAIYQNIVEDQLNHLIREKLLPRSQCMRVRDAFCSIIAGKLRNC